MWFLYRSVYFTFFVQVLTDGMFAFCLQSARKGRGQRGGLCCFNPKHKHRVGCLFSSQSVLKASMQTSMYAVILCSISWNNKITSMESRTASRLHFGMLWWWIRPCTKICSELWKVLLNDDEMDAPQKQVFSCSTSKVVLNFVSFFDSREEHIRLSECLIYEGTFVFSP